MRQPAMSRAHRRSVGAMPSEPVMLQQAEAHDQVDRPHVGGSRSCDGVVQSAMQGGEGALVTEGEPRVAHACQGSGVPEVLPVDDVMPAWLRVPRQS